MSSSSSSSPLVDEPFSPAVEEDDSFITRESQDATRPFRLRQSVVDSYRDKKPPFGFNGLGEFVYQTRYARVLPDGSKEKWYQTVERVVNGTYNMQKRWITQHDLGWKESKAQESAREMFDRIFQMKFLPPGRGLWAMGSPMTEDRMLFAALNNCAFVSTEELKRDPTKPFTFLMDAAMLGVGVGFDTDGAGTIKVAGIAGGGEASASSSSSSSRTHVVGDSREGWVESLRLLLDAHFSGKPRPSFDYTAIRPRGSPIKGFGGTASGPDVLKRLHEDVDKTLTPLAGKPITVTAIVDIMNQIGRCVVSGDVRQTAEIAFGSPHSEEYIDLKNYGKNPQRGAWGWTSNNSVYADLGMSYDGVARRIASNGEPGFAWLENMRAYGRMGDPPNFKDRRAKGGNPCLEQTLESYELCCLVETFPNNHESLDDFKRTLKYAYLYAKTVTLGRTHWPSTNRVMLRNRRIGCSVSGVAQFVADKGMHRLRHWCDEGYGAIQEYDVQFSDWLAIPRSIKSTCVKPSGTVSLLAGATPGMHYPESRFYLRRVRVGKDHEVVAPLRAAGFHVEPAVEVRFLRGWCMGWGVGGVDRGGEGGREKRAAISNSSQLSFPCAPIPQDPDRKVVITFPVDAAAGREQQTGQQKPTSRGSASSSSSSSSSTSSSTRSRSTDVEGAAVGRLRTLDELTMWEQFSLAALLQRHWADNQVSCTITFDPEREGPQIARALDVFQYQLKGVSLLPRAPKLAYKQLPYEAITEEEYRRSIAQISPVDFSNLNGDNPTAPDRFCDSSRCDLESAGATAAASQAPEETGKEGAGLSKRNLPRKLKASAAAQAAAASSSAASGGGGVGSGGPSSRNPPAPSEEAEDVEVDKPAAGQPRGQ
jgi:ribonucleoside-triphosphate reductase